MMKVVLQEHATYSQTYAVSHRSSGEQIICFSLMQLIVIFSFLLHVVMQ